MQTIAQMNHLTCSIADLRKRTAQKYQKCSWGGVQHQRNTGEGICQFYKYNFSFKQAGIGSCCGLKGFICVILQSNNIVLHPGCHRVSTEEEMCLTCHRAQFATCGSTAVFFIPFVYRNFRVLQQSVSIWKNASFATDFKNLHTVSVQNWNSTWCWYLTRKKWKDQELWVY